MRLFVAVEISPEVKASLQMAMDALRRQGTGNFTRPENLHLTLAFIGETARVKAAVSAIQEVEAAAFSFTLSGIGRFGDLYWAGVAPSPALAELEKQVSNLLQSQGFSLENRLFRPHLTLCRAFRPKEGFDRKVAEIALGNPVCWVDRVRLMASSRFHGRLTYTEVSHKKLLSAPATFG